MHDDWGVAWGELPSEIILAAYSDGQRFGGAWFKVDVPTSSGNSAATILGPADPTGQLVVRTSDLRRKIDLVRSMFPMDYGSWVGDLVVKVVDYGDLQGLRQAFDLWGASSAVNDPAQLDQIDAALRAHKGHRLRATIQSTEATTWTMRSSVSGT
jgi:hypothetical protein